MSAELAVDGVHLFAGIPRTNTAPGRLERSFVAEEDERQSNALAEVSMAAGRCSKKVWSANLECLYPEHGTDAGWTVATSTAIAFVQTVLERDPNKRPTAEEAMKHEFLTEACALQSEVGSERCDDVDSQAGLASIPDISCYAFADGLTVISSNWDSLSAAFDVLCSFCSILINVKFGPRDHLQGPFPQLLNQCTFRFYPFSLGSPIDIATSYDDSLSKQDSCTLLRAKRIARLSDSYEVAYRLFVSFVSSCYT